MKVELFCDARERAIQDSINGEFTKPAIFAKTVGEIVCTVKQVVVGDYTVTVDGQVVAVMERKTLKDYGASFKDNRHANKAKLINARNLTGCQIYYIIEGPLNPDYETEYAGIKYKNILASINDLMIRDGIFIIRTQDGNHTARELKMFCERQSSLQVLQPHPNLITDNQIIELQTSDSFSGDTTSIMSADHAEVCEQDNSDPTSVVCGQDRSRITFEELQTAADLTPEEKLCKCRIEAWKSLPGVGNSTAIHLASQYSLADWIMGKFADPESDLAKSAANYKFNGRRNKRVSELLISKPSAELQVGILAAMSGLTVASATEIISQYPLDNLLANVDYSAIRYGTKKTKLTKQRVERIKSFLVNTNNPNTN